MKITIVAVGKTRGTLAPAVAEMEERAGRYWKLEVVEVASGRGKGGATDDDGVRRAEGARIRARIPEGSEAWALTRDGDPVASGALAKALGERALRGGPSVAFLVGGAFGLDSDTIRTAHRRLSLSAMTLPHELARLVLAEQLYRAGTILRGEPYHKGSS